PAAASAPLLALLAFTCPTPASAQTTGTTTTTQSSNQAIDANLIVKRNGEMVENGTLVYATVADCGGDPTDPAASRTAPNTFTFSANYNTTVPVVEAWLGVGNGENCATSANRVKQGSGALPPLCTFLGVDTSGSRTPTITVPGNQLFQQDGWRNNNDKPAIDRDCDAVSGSPAYTVYFIPLQTTTTDVNGSEPSSIGTLSTLKATFSPFTRRPSAPTSLTPLSGESEIGVSFKAPSSSMTLTTYRAYFDISGQKGTNGQAGLIPDAGMDAGLDAGAISIVGADGSVSDSGTSADLDASTVSTGALMCGAGPLENNQPPPINQANIRRSGVEKSTTIKLQDLSGVPVGTSVAVAVVALDPAKNESKLSVPVCVERVSTNGFWDTCNKTEGCSDGFDSCSLSPTRSGSAWSFGLFSLALAALIRRRRRA
ncbi:MAG: hypothetical protein JWN48_2125, partial [Myxococcaceae bacterium]|nr:hypothetical protein [Myxococcaceae bacterium]